MKCILNDVMKMVRIHGDGKNESGNGMTLWNECPHFTWDKYVSGDQIFDYMGNQEFGALMTCR